MNKNQNKNRNQKQNPDTMKGVLIGASVVALAAGAIFGITRSGWSLGGKKESGKQSGGGVSGGGAASQVDVALNEEVAGNVTSNPSTENNFTDEGATGNND